MRARLGLLLALLLTAGLTAADGAYEEPETFVAGAFGGNAPAPSMLWLTGDRKLEVRKILDHDYSTMRIRYWREDDRTVWVLDEIGKEQPITAGFVVARGALETVHVLVFRESRGWEIRHPFFTDQFKDAELNTDGQLNKSIDGISGATLSVRAMKKLATLALYLDAQARSEHVESTP